MFVKEEGEDLRPRSTTLAAPTHGRVVRRAVNCSDVAAQNKSCVTNRSLLG
jgi:hypothetical protein